MKPFLSYFSHSKTALGIKTAAIILAVLALYNQDLATIASEAIRSEIMSYIIAIPFLLTYLIYRKRKMLGAAMSIEPPTPKKKTIHTKEVAGVLLCLTSFLVYWHGSYTFNPLEYHVVSMPIFIAGLVLAIFNSETLKVLAFSIGFLVFLTPPPLEAFYAAGTILSTTSSEVAYTFLKMIGLPVSLTTEYGPPAIVLNLQSGAPIPFTVDLACSGMYSLTGFIVFSAFIAYISRGKTWKKAIIFLVGFPLVYSLNIARIISLVLMGHTLGVEAALQAFHLLGGLALTFLGTVTLLILSDKALKLSIFTNEKTKSCQRCETSIKNKEEFCIRCGRILKNKHLKISIGDIIKVLLLIAFVSSIASIQVPIFALTKGPAGTVLDTPTGYSTTVAEILPEIPGYTLGFIFRDEEFEKIAKQDASLIYSYNPLNNSKRPVFIGLEIADSKSNLHPWEVCLITSPEKHGYQPRVTRLDQRDVKLIENPPIFGRFLAVQWKETGLLQVILYWYENAIFKTNSSLESKIAKISLVAYSDNPEEYHEIEEYLLYFGKSVANYWQPIKAWSVFAVTIAQNGSYLAGVSIVSLSALVVFQTARNVDKKKRNLKIYEKLVPEEKLLIKAVIESLRGPSTLSNISMKYEELSGKPIDLNVLLRKLREAEEAGLVKPDLASRVDEPILVWKSQVPLGQFRGTFLGKPISLR